MGGKVEYSLKEFHSNTRMPAVLKDLTADYKPLLELFAMKFVKQTLADRKYSMTLLM